MAHRVGLLRRTDSVAIEGIADIGEALLPVGATRLTPTRHQADGRAHGAGISEGIQNHSDSERFRSSPRTCHALGCRLSVRDSRFPALRIGTHHERAGYRGEAE